MVRRLAELRRIIAAPAVRRFLAPLAGILFLVWGFVSLASEIAEGETRAADEWVLRAMRTSDLTDPIGPPRLEDMARDATALGGNVVIGILILTVKLGFDRPRPDLVPHLQTVYTSSFPSGHSMGAALTYLTLAAMIARMERRSLDQAFPIVVALILSALVGMSRVYLGVHYPTDVLGGWAIGTAWALLCWAMMDWMEGRLAARSQIPDSNS